MQFCDDDDDDYEDDDDDNDDDIYDSEYHLKRPADLAWNTFWYNK